MPVAARPGMGCGCGDAGTGRLSRVTGRRLARLDVVTPILDFVGNFWWLVFPLGGVVGGWVKGYDRWSDRRRKDRIRILELQREQRGHVEQVARAEQEDIDRVLALHDRVDERWFHYEMDLATIIDFPVMVDMREPAVRAFHEAKAEADALRPADPDVLHDARRLSEYRAAVNAYSVAFEAAEREARRRRISDYSDVERGALTRARKLIALADNPGATYAERQAAYRRAIDELQGIIVVPTRAATAIESRIAGALPAGAGGTTPQPAEPRSADAERPGTSEA